MSLTIFSELQIAKINVCQHVSTLKMLNIFSANTATVNKRLTFSLRFYDCRMLHVGAKNDMHTFTPCGAEREHY